MYVPVLDIDEFLALKTPAMFYINSLENHLFENRALIDHPHKHDFYVLVLFTRGQGTHEIDFENYSVEPGAVFCLNPGQTHHWRLSPDAAGIILFHTEFNQSKANSYSYLPFYQRVHNHPKIQLNQNDQAYATQQLQTMLDEFRADLAYKWRMLQARLDVIYLFLARTYLEQFSEEMTDATHANRMREFERLVDQYLPQERQVSFYANTMHLSPRQLNRIVQQTIGKTPIHYLHDQLILAAKRLLVNQTIPLNDVSLKLGFEEYSAFSAFFKKKTNFSPKEFRKNYQ